MHFEDRVRVGHMIEAGEAAIQFVAGRKRADLDTDLMLMFAIVRAVEVIGEAASKISEETGRPWQHSVESDQRHA